MEQQEGPPIGETEDWRSRHPLLKAAREETGFIVFHTIKLEDQNIEQAIRENKSIEIDVNILGAAIGKYPKNLLVNAHHPWYYLGGGGGGKIPDYQNIPTPDEILAQVEGKNVFVKFDLKTPSVIPWLLANANRIAPHLRMVHCFLAELQYSYRQEKGHTVTDYVSLEDVKKVREALAGIPFQVSCRGVSLENITTKIGDSFPVVDWLCQEIKGNAEVINFHLMDEQKLPPEIIRYTWQKHRLMTEVNIDESETAPLGIPFLGRTDYLDSASESLPDQMNQLPPRQT